MSPNGESAMSKATTVTAIKPQKKGKNRVNLFLDGKFTLGLSASVLDEAGIHAGQNLSRSEVENLKRADLTQRAMDQALRYLGYRPRSESEVRARLARYGYEDDVIARTLNRLRTSGLISDTSFATFWKESRVNFSPRSNRLLTQELRQKGVSSEIIAATTEGIDNETEAYRAGYKKAHSLDKVDYYEFRRKLGAFLHRRGFDYEVIKSVVDKLWQERELTSEKVKKLER